MKRFVVIYRGQAFPVFSRSAEKIKFDIINAYARQDGRKKVTFQNITMVSSDIANGNYTILDLDNWFREGVKKKGSVAAPVLVDEG